MEYNENRDWNQKLSRLLEEGDLALHNAETASSARIMDQIEGNLFDLSAAIQLLRQLPSYPQRQSHLADHKAIEEWKSSFTKWMDGPTAPSQQDSTQSGLPLISTLLGDTDYTKIASLEDATEIAIPQKTVAVPLAYMGTSAEWSEDLVQAKPKLHKSKLKSVSLKAPSIPRKNRVHTFTPAFRRLNLIQKLLQDFGDLGPTLVTPLNGKGAGSSTNDPIHVFIDHSNIMIGLFETMKRAPESKIPIRRRPAILSFENLAVILERGRICDKRVLVGSSKSSPSVVQARDVGYETSILQRVPRLEDTTDHVYSSSENTRSAPELKQRHGEQGVDEVLIMKMLESLLDYPPATVVLATGDGNIAEFSDGFRRAAQRCLYYGWKVELVAFKRSISRSWQNIHDVRFRIILLDDYIFHLVENPD